MEHVDRIIWIDRLNMYLRDRQEANEQHTADIEKARRNIK